MSETDAFWDEVAHVYAERDALQALVNDLAEPLREWNPTGQKGLRHIDLRVDADLLARLDAAAEADQ